MKKWIWPAALILLLAGCAGAAEPTAPPPTTRPQATAPTREETRPRQEIPVSHYINKVYSLQLREYYTALLEQWPAELYEQAQRSPMGAEYRQGDPLQNVGFALEDLDDDGYCELVIGATRDEDTDPEIFELWTAPGLEPERLFSSRPGDRCCLEKAGDQWGIQRRVGEAEDPDAYYYYTLKDGKTKLELGLRRSRDPQEQPVWHRVGEEPDQQPEILEAEAVQSLTKRRARQKSTLRYYPFYLYTP